MDTICNDPVFGTMQYKHGWQKRENVTLLGKIWPLTIAAQAYRGKPITAAEQTGYQYVQKNWQRLQAELAQALTAYVRENAADIRPYYPRVETLLSPEGLVQAVTPKKLYCQLDGSVVLLLDCAWDEEDGLGIQVYPTLEIASQDAFL